jgi:hypothetical protein
MIRFFARIMKTGLTMARNGGIRRPGRACLDEKGGEHCRKRAKTMKMRGQTAEP